MELVRKPIYLLPLDVHIKKKTPTKFTRSRGEMTESVGPAGVFLLRQGRGHIVFLATLHRGNLLWLKYVFLLNL